MGTDYSIACIECRLFIDLHKWPVVDELRDKLNDAYNHREPGIQIPEISNYPVVYFDFRKGLSVLSTVHKEPFYNQTYIQKLVNTLKIFLTKHNTHTLILSCDMGAEPWQIGEPVWFQWKEIISAFDFAARFLPRNLVDDFKFSNWEQVIDYYKEHEAWFLHDQLKEQREELKKRFNEIIY